jgi:hypothetical protein
MKRKFWTDFFWLLVFAFAGAIIVVLAMIPITAFTKGTLMLHLVQWGQTLLMMLLPAILWTILYKKERVSEVMHTQRPTWKVVGLVVLLMIVSLPALDALATACESLPLPEPLGSWAKNNAEAQQLTIDTMLGVSGFGGWFELIMLMCIGTAIGEEWMFRGALLRCFKGYNKHWAAVFVGLLFSVIHLEAYGFIPRWLLGTGFVYLVYWTRSIWPGVIAHAINNLWALIEMKEAPKSLEHFGAVTVFVSIVLMALVLWLIYREGQQRATCSIGVGADDRVDADGEC